MDHLLDVLPRASVLEVKGAHHWIHSRALLRKGPPGPNGVDGVARDSAATRMPSSRLGRRRSPGRGAASSCCWSPPCAGMRQADDAAVLELEPPLHRAHLGMQSRVVERERFDGLGG